MDLEERNKIIAESDEHWSELAARFDLSRSSIYRIRKEHGETVSKGRPNVARYARNMTMTGKTSRSVYEQLASSGLSRHGGLITEEFQRELQGESGVATYIEMATHPVVAAVLFAIEMALRRVNWSFEPASKDAEAEDAAEFLNQCWNDMAQSPTEVMSQIFRPMIKFGYSLCEIVYKLRLGQDPKGYITDPATSKYDDRQIGWRRFQFINPMSLAPYERWIFDDNGRVQAVRQGSGLGDEGQEINMKKLLLFRTTVEFDNPEGLSPLRAMFVPWFYARHLQEIEAIAAERLGVGLPTMYLNQNCSFEGSDSDFQLAKEVVTNVRADEQSGLVIPAAKLGTHEQGEAAMLFELVAPPSRGFVDFGEPIDRQEKRMAMVCLAQFIFLGMGRVGTQALASTQVDFFVEAVGAWSDGVASVFDRFAIPRLMRYNGYDNPLMYPETHHSEAGVPDLYRLAQYVNQLARHPIIEPYEELEDYLLELADLPPRPEGTRLSSAQRNPQPEDENQVPPGDKEDQGQMLPGIDKKLRGSEIFSHNPDRVASRCPLCGFGEAFYYPDHGSAVVCAGCGKTYDREVE